MGELGNGKLDRSSARVLAAVEAFWAQHGYSPSLQDVAKAVPLSKSNSYAHLKRLRELGAVTFDDGIARSIVVVKGRK